MRKIVTYHLKSATVLVLIMLVGTVVGGVIVSHQRINPPAWVPLVGKDDFVLRAELTSVQGILPGQGQAVTISGVRVGSIGPVELKDGSAVAELRIERKYAHIYPNATVLLRPKTPLKDMVAELDPGSAKSGDELRDGARLSTARTNPDVNLEEILATLDRDSRDYLDLLVSDGAQALGKGGGKQLASVFREFEPLSRDVGRASRLVARRRALLRELVGNLSRLSTELGARDADIARFVRSSSAVFRRFANQSSSLQRTVQLLPEALQRGNDALAKVDKLGRSLNVATKNLEPTARTLGPTLRQGTAFFKGTTATFRDQIRPFAVAAQQETRLLQSPTRKLSAATPKLKTLSGVLNAIFNEVAYKAPGNTADKNSFLFYIPWASHNSNSVLSYADGIGPIRRGQVLVSCTSLQVLETLASPTQNPTLATLVQLLGVPKRETICNSPGSGK